MSLYADNVERIIREEATLVPVVGGSKLRQKVALWLVKRLVPHSVLVIPFDRVTP